MSLPKTLSLQPKSSPRLRARSSRHRRTPREYPPTWRRTSYPPTRDGPSRPSLRRPSGLRPESDRRHNCEWWPIHCQRYPPAMRQPYKPPFRWPSWPRRQPQEPANLGPRPRARPVRKWRTEVRSPWNRNPPRLSSPRRKPFCCQPESPARRRWFRPTRQAHWWWWAPRGRWHPRGWPAPGRWYIRPKANLPHSTPRRHRR